MKIETKALTMEYNDAGRIVEVFRDIEMTVPSGTKLAVVGESGIGKTTLLYLLGGLERPTSGEVFLDGQSLTSGFNSQEALSQFRGKNIGFIFQFHHLLPEFDAIENTAMPLFLQGIEQEIAREQAKALLERVGLRHRLTHRPGMLSGGEQQRVAIARALAINPGVLLADEPTGNLDQKTAAEVHNLLLEIHREKKMTLLIVTHSLELAQMMDTVSVLTPSGLTTR